MFYLHFPRSLRLFSNCPEERPWFGMFTSTDYLRLTPCKRITKGLPESRIRLTRRGSLSSGIHWPKHKLSILETDYVNRVKNGLPRGLPTIYIVIHIASRGN